MHPYGVETGLIDPADYRDFSNEQEDRDVSVAMIDGVLTRIQRVEML